MADDKTAEELADLIDDAVNDDDEAALMTLLAAGGKPTTGTQSKLGPATTDRMITALVDAGLDLNADDGPLATFTGMLSISTEERLAYVRRLIGHGFALNALQLREMLGALHKEFAAGADGIALLALACERGVVPDAELVRLVLERLPVAALDVVVAAGGTFPAGARVKSTAPDAAAKQAWLAARGAPAKASAKPKPKGKGKAAAEAPEPIPWTELARLDGADLTPELVAARLFGDGQAFPGPPVDSFEAGIVDEDLPVSHDLVVDDYLEYRIQFWMAGSHGVDAYQKHAKAMFDALLAAGKAALGKPDGKGTRRGWELADREVSLVSYHHHDAPRPYVEITLSSKPKSTS
jgi:hypothetical protein